MDFARGCRVAFQSVWPVLTIILNFLSKNSLLIKAVSKNEMEDIAGYGRQRLHDFDTPWCAGSALRRNKANAELSALAFFGG